MDENKLNEILNNLNGYIAETETKIENTDDVKTLSEIRCDIQEVINTRGKTKDNIYYKLSELDSLAQNKVKGIEGNENSKQSVEDNETILEYDDDETILDYEDYDDIVPVDFEPDVEEENKNELKSQVKEDAKDKKLAELLAELSKTQATKLIVTIARDGKEMQKTVNEKVKNLKTYLNNQAELYGANKEVIAQVVEDYESKLEETRYAAETTYCKKLQERIEKQNAETTAIKALKRYKKENEPKYAQTKAKYNRLANDLAKAVKARDEDKIKEIQDELETKKEILDGFENEKDQIKKKIKDAREAQKTLKKEMKDEKKEAKAKLDKNKVNKMVEEELKKQGLTKQNGFNKFIGFISNIGKKMGGESAFKKKVLNPIGNAITSMAEGIKAIPGKASAKKQEIIETIKESIQHKITQNKEQINDIRNTKTASKEEEYTI